MRYERECGGKNMPGTAEILAKQALKYGRAFYRTNRPHLSKRDLLAFAKRTAQRQCQTNAERHAFVSAVKEALASEQR